MSPADPTTEIVTATPAIASPAIPISAHVSAHSHNPSGSRSPREPKPFASFFGISSGVNARTWYLDNSCSMSAKLPLLEPS